MCEAVAVCCGLTSVAIQWQPMPASARLPSGTGVERLCGHPAQKPGLRIGAGRLLSIAPGGSGALSAQFGSWREIALTNTPATRSGEISPKLGIACAPGEGSNASPSKYLPTMRGVREVAIEDRANLILEQRALLLDHDNEIETAGELAHDHWIERPHHADLKQAEAERGAVVGKAEIAERLQQVLPRLAGRDHTDPRAVAFANDTVEAVGARIGERGRQLVVVEPLLLGDRRIDCSRAQASGRVARRFGDDDLWLLGADIDCAPALGNVGDHLHANPTAGKPRHRDAVQAEIKQLLSIRRVDHRHADGDE